MLHLHKILIIENLAALYFHFPWGMVFGGFFFTVTNPSKASRKAQTIKTQIKLLCNSVISNLTVFDTHCPHYGQMTH